MMWLLGGSLTRVSHVPNRNSHRVSRGLFSFNYYMISIYDSSKLKKSRRLWLSNGSCSVVRQPALTVARTPRVTYGTQSGIWARHAAYLMRQPSPCSQARSRLALTRLVPGAASIVVCTRPTLPSQPAPPGVTDARCGCSCGDIHTRSASLEPTEAARQHLHVVALPLRPRGADVPCTVVCGPRGPQWRVRTSFWCS